MLQIYRKKEINPSNVFPFGQHCEPPSEKIASPRDKIREGRENYNDVKRPSSSIRNPLTGTGLSSNDEYKFKGNKRKGALKINSLYTRFHEYCRVPARLYDKRIYSDSFTNVAL